MYGMEVARKRNTTFEQQNCSSEINLRAIFATSLTGNEKLRGERCEQVRNNHKETTSQPAGILGSTRSRVKVRVRVYFTLL